MEQLLLHLFGDFIVQNDWMALNKKENSLKGLSACFIHCLTYSLPFFLLTNWLGVLFIFLTHFIFDSSHIVSYFLMYKNGAKDINNFGYNKERPFALTIWLNIITDNTIHLILNYIIIDIFNKII